MADFGAPQPGQPAAPAPKPEWTPEALELLMEDFDLTNMDLAPTADPKSVTDQQRLMRAEYLGQFLQPEMSGGLDTNEIKRRMFEASGQDDIDKLFAKGPDPMQELQVKGLKAEVKETEASAVEKMARAENLRQGSMEKSFDRGLKQGALDGGVLSVEDAAGLSGGVPGAEGDGGSGPAGMDEPAAPAGE